MSVAGLIVPNNFNIASSGSDIAEGLYSSNNSNVINTTASSNPIADQVLTASGPNAATWITPSVTPTNLVALTNKTLTDSTNNIAASLLFTTGSSVNVAAATSPVAGEVLTATSSVTATWQPIPIIPPVNKISGGFSGVGAAGAGTTLTTIDFGNNPGAYHIEGIISANVNTGSSSAGYRVGAIFHIPLAGGLVVKDQSFANDQAGSGTMNTETPPQWEIDSGTIIKLEKKGGVNSVWGGSWSYSQSGIV